MTNTTHNNMKTQIGLIPCCGPKDSNAKTARDLYTSDLFKKNAEYADNNFDAWYILSAEYGILQLHDTVETYDKKLKRGKNEDWSDAVLGDFMTRVVTDFEGESWEDIEVVFMCGESYRSGWESTLQERFETSIPMKGLEIGEQKSWLKEQNSI